MRHRDGAERTLLTAIANGASPPALADLLLSAVTDRYYADGGHALDFINKAMEALDHVGWQHAGAVLPGIIEQMVGARGREEANAWRHPIDLVPLLEEAFASLLREDAGFHTFQNYEAALAQYREWDGVEGHHILIALARFLAAHAPTPRAHH